MQYLENEFLKVEIDERGAQLSRVYSPEYDWEYIWINDPEIWSWRAPNLFPIVGELKEGKYKYHGNTYFMGRHGFMRDAPFEASMEGEELVFSIKNDENSLGIYPFEFEYQVRYRLVGKTLLQYYHVHNPSVETAMPFSLGGHPAFTAGPVGSWKLVFSENESAKAQMLSDKGLRIDRYKDGIVNGRISLEKDTFKDDALIFKGLKSTYCELRSDDNPRMVRFHFAQFPYLGIWAKHNAPYVCIEPWYGVADHENTDGKIINKEGIEMLPPESTFRIGFTMEFL